MSFGRSENVFGDTSLNSVFTTPTSHSGVTFVASTGDTGQPGGFPAYSPNVLAVGGTSLTINSSNNNYVSESGWSGSGGGISQVESKPAYQSSVTQSPFYRTIPDVAFDANPSSGPTIYDSYNNGTTAPWIQIGGTSFSAPVWAGLIAIANQGRTWTQQTALDGPSQTLPSIYGLSTTDFHDITSGNNGFAAVAGYDLVTGRGTPIANLVAADLSRNPNLIVSSTTPFTGTVVSAPPVDFVVQFNNPYTPGSVQAGDLTVNGIAANSFSLTDASTITFHYNSSPVTVQGLQTIALSAGAITRLSDSNNLLAYSGTFRYDVLLTQVTSTTPATGSIVPTTLSSIQLKFNEAYAPASLSTSDLTLSQGTVSSFSQVDSTTVQFNLSGITSEGTLTFSVAAGAITDTFGNPAADFSGSYTLDNSTTAYPTPLVSVGPVGGLIYDPSVSGLINFVGDTDSYTLNLDAGQTLSVLVTTAAGLQARVDVNGPGGTIGSASSSAPGTVALIQTAPVATAGTYTIVVSGLNSTTGSYTVQAVLNAALENESNGGAANSTQATAQDLSGSFISLIGSASRGAVLGTLTAATGDDWYSFSLNAGDSATIGANISSGGTPTLELYDSVGNPLALGVSGVASSASPVISDFFVQTSGVYFVRLSGSGTISYSLIVARNADLDARTNGQTLLASQISGQQVALGGFLAPTTIESFDDPTELSKYTATSSNNHSSLTSTAAHDGSLGLSLVPTTQYIFRADTAVAVQQGEVLSAWVRSEGTGTVGQAYFGFGANASFGSMFIVMDGTTNQLQLQNNVFFTSPQTISSVSQTWLPNHWYRFEVNWGIGNAIAAKVYDSDGTTLLNTVSASIPQGFPSGGLAFGGAGRTIDFDSITMGLPQAPTYSVQMAGGATLQARTFTPGDGSGEPVNLLDPKLQILSSTGIVVATDDNSAPDGRNAQLNYLVPASSAGTYFVQVTNPVGNGPSTIGNYELAVTGALPPSPAFTVTTTTPTNSALLMATITQITVNFSSQILLPSLQAGDLTVDGQAATAFTVVNGRSVTFTLPTITEGVHTVAFAASSVVSIQNIGITAYAGQFTVDLTPPKVFSSSIQQGDVIPTGSLSYVVGFSEPMNKTNLSSGDFSLKGADLNLSYSASSFSFDAAGTTLTINYANLPEDRYTLTLFSGSSAFADLAGHTLDGEALTWPIPSNTSGNGVDGGNFVVQFSTDNPTRAFPTPLTSQAPSGSQIYSGTVTTDITTATDSDLFTLSLDAGQTISLLATPLTGSGLQPVVTLLSPSNATLGSQGAAAAGQNAVLQSIPIAVAGIYTISVGGGSGTLGQTSIQVLLNAAVETESTGGGGDDSMSAAQNLDGNFVSLGGAASKVAVQGFNEGAVGSLPAEIEPNNSTTTSNDASANFSAAPSNLYQLILRGTISPTFDQDFFNIGALDVGDVITIAGYGIASTRGGLTDPEIHLWNGTTLVRSATAGSNYNALISRYTITTASTYYISVESPGFNTNSYEVGVWLENSGTVPLSGGTKLNETEPNDFTAQATDMSNSWKAVQYVSTTAATAGGNSDYYKFLFNAGDMVTIRTQSVGDNETRTHLLNSSGATLAYDSGEFISPLVDSPIYAYLIPTTGTYYIQDDAQTGTTTYTNAVYLSSAFAPLTPTAGVDDYSVTLAMGDHITVGLKSVSTGTVSVGLLDSSGNPITQGVATSQNYDSVISNFAVPSSGLYYLQISGTKNDVYDLVVTKNATLDIESNNSLATAQPLDSTTQLALGSVGTGTPADSDYYTVSADAGTTLIVTTTTPGDGPFEFVNSLDPALELYNPAGVLVSNNDNGAADGRNARMTYSVSATGVYTIRVKSAAGSGEYTVGASLGSTNTAPVLDTSGTLQLPTIFENQSANTGMLISALLASGGGANPISDP